MKKHLSILGSLLILCVTLNAFGKTKAEVEPLIKIFEKYRAAEEIDSNIKKTIYQAALGKETNFEGALYISKGKFRLETESPEKSLLVYDGTYLWSMEGETDVQGTPPQISKSKINRKNNGNFLFTLLFGNSSLQNSFEIKKEDSIDGLGVFSLKPKNEMNISDLKIYINTDDGNISKIIYLDEIGNKTSLHLLSTKFLKSMNTKLFKFKLPKGAQVTEL